MEITVTGTSEAKTPREVYDLMKPLAARIMSDLRSNGELSKYATTEIWAAVMRAFSDALAYEMLTH